MTEQKWRSPTGASIASLETDHIPDGGRMVSEPMNDLKQIRDDVYTIVGLNDEQSKKDEAFDRIIATLDRIIETPAPTEIVATEAEQLRKERDGFKLENESLKYFVQIENIMHSMYKGECFQLHKENEGLKAKLDGLLNIIDKQHSAHLELQAKLDNAKWQPIETCPRKHGVNYRLWDSDDLEERVTWFGDGMWCVEGNYTHWMPLPDAPEQL